MNYLQTWDSDKVARFGAHKAREHQTARAAAARCAPWARESWRQISRATARMVMACAAELERRSTGGVP